MIPVILSMFGLGMIVGNIVGGRLADRGLEKTVRLLLIWAILVLSAYVYTSH
ncbi:Arabinose efflux permease [Cedecea neteri]|nr:Arabinose efflux permease [Cedecea neteri]